MELNNEQLADCQYIAAKICEVFSKELINYLSHQKNMNASVGDVTLIPACIISLMVASVANTISYQASKFNLPMKPDEILDLIYNSSKVISNELIKQTVHKMKGN